MLAIGGYQVQNLALNIELRVNGAVRITQNAFPSSEIEGKTKRELTAVIINEPMAMLHSSSAPRHQTSISGLRFFI